MWGGGIGNVVVTYGIPPSSFLFESWDFCWTGKRRWILAAPDTCKDCYVITLDHPTMGPCFRHSEVDWGNPDLERFPRFANMRGHELILLPGEALYMPSYWLHQVVNLDFSLQCNGFSTVKSERGTGVMKECGFFIPLGKLVGKHKSTRGL